MRFQPPATRAGPLVWILAISCLALGIFLLWLNIRTIWGAQTISYEITEADVIVNFGPQSVVLNRASVSEIAIIEQPSRARRHVGTSAPGLYQGRWSFAETGRIELYATSLRPLTVIVAEQGKWGISPMDPQGFVDTFESEATGLFPAVPTENTWFLIIFAATSLLLCVVLGVLSFYLFSVMRNLAYELTDEQIIVHGGWRPIVIPYDAVTDVQLMEPKGQPFRTWGVGAPGLYFGRFSWRSVGPNLRLYATRLRPLVVVTTDEKTYALTPENPQHFIEELGKRTSL